MSFDLTGLGALFDFGTKLIDRIIPDPQAKLAANQKLTEMALSKELAELASSTDLAKGQMDINKEEAKSSSLFVSGWRPSIGWVCSAAFAMNYVAGPIITFVSTAYTGRAVAWPTLPVEVILPVLFGILGLGAFRTTEKIKGVA
jgi:hypothetical protein